MSEYVARVAIYQTTQATDASLVCSLLEGNGIPATMENEHVSQWLFGMSTPAFPLIVSVSREDARAAAEIVRTIRPKRSSRARRPTSSNRRWLIGLALLVPGLAAGQVNFGGSHAFAAAGAWAALAIGLILDLRDRRPGLRFSEAKVGLFFLMGAASTGAVSILHPMISPMTGFLKPTSKEIALASMIEEASKFLPVLLVLGLMRGWRRDPFAWVLAGTCAGAGFGFVENLVKLGLYYGDAASAAVITAAGLGHAVWTGLIGLFCMEAKTRTSLIFRAIVGWLAASMLHGIWNFLAFEEVGWLCLGGLTIAAVVYFRSVDRWLVRKHSPRAQSTSPAS